MAKRDTKVVWEDPPEPRYPRRPTLLAVLSDTLRQVRGRPNTWARVASYKHPRGSCQAATRMRKLLPAGWEFRGPTGTAEGGSHLYARYTGKAVPLDHPLVKS